jgi:hypothetical protein
MRITRAFQQKIQSPRSREKRKTATAMAAIAAVAVLSQKYSANHNKQPKNTSQMTGQEWIEELLAGHPKRFYNNMGMNKHVFKQLIQELIQVGLHDTRYVTSEEQLAIFLYLAVTGLAQRHLEERFQRSADTISK